MAYTVDPELAAIQHMLPKADLSDLPGARALSRQFLEQRPPYEPNRELSISDRLVPGSNGGPDVPIRIFAPAKRSGLLPGLIYLRSSGFSLGSLGSADTPASRIADHLDVAVIAVDYRLAPEHPYPAALDDSYAVLEWATSSPAADLAIDPSRVAVLGDSAGGGLATALSMLTRDRQGPTLIAQFLDAPTIDDRCNTPSMKQFTDTPMWRAPDTPIIWQYYLGRIERGADQTPVYAAPARATVKDLVGLPPAWVATYQLDPTRDEVLAFANRLIQADVPTEMHHYAGAFHLAHTIPGTSIGERIHADKLSAIGRILGR
ncbi:alpha/beta hydrolase [Micromonospora sp. NPDC050397]|uniref:alpha/beta hydrolase n=1 Tax=Micromonospora sp. NPDC050397 TaxID=3364279 RepID=UPI0038515524